MGVILVGGGVHGWCGVGGHGCGGDVCDSAVAVVVRVGVDMAVCKGIIVIGGLDVIVVAVVRVVVDVTLVGSGVVMIVVALVMVMSR